MGSQYNKNRKFKTLTPTTGLLALHVGLAASLAFTSALAQTVPGSVDPSKVEKRFDKVPTPSSSRQGIVPVAPAPQLSKQQQATLSKQRFTLKNVALQGNTVYSQDQLKFAYDGMTGKEISLLDAQTIARRITDFYRNNGYVLTQAIIPPQAVKNGTLTIRVLEGYIANVVIQGDVREKSGRKIVEAYGEQLTKKRPIRINDLERYLLLMDDLPGATAKGLVRPSSTQVGAADLIVTFTHKTFEASYTLDNRGSKYVGPWQHTGTLVGNSLLGMYDRTMLRIITTSPTTELRFFDLQHEEQIGREGTRLVFTGSHSRTEPGDILKALDIRAESTFLQLKALHPFIRSRQENLVGRVLFDTRNTTTDVFVNTNLSKDRLRVLRAGGAYDFADKLMGVNLIDLEISQGLDIWNATDTDPISSRSDAEADFTKVNLDITRTQSLPGNFSLYASATGQYAFDKLLPAEQFTLGGSNFGRAYDPAELSGDHGAAGKIELRYGEPSDGPYLSSFQVYGFYDVGRVWTRGGSSATDKSLASAGIGVRTNFTETISANLELADPLTRDASNQGRHGEDPRLFFSVTGRY